LGMTAAQVEEGAEEDVSVFYTATAAVAGCAAVFALVMAMLLVSLLVPLLARLAWRLVRAAAWVVLGPLRGRRSRATSKEAAAAAKGSSKPAPTGLWRLWESKAFSDAMVVFTTEPHAAKDAVQGHMAAVERRIKQNQGWFADPAASDAAAIRVPVAWPAASRVFHSHQFHMAASSKVFEKQLLDAADMSADQGLQVLSNGTWKRVLVVGLDSPELLDAAEPLMHITYGSSAGIQEQPDLLLQVCAGFNVSLHDAEG
jgi:hypothetical protein